MEIQHISKGNKFGINQDRYRIENNGKYLAIVVADGMGGLSLGEIAAETVVNSMIEYIVKHYHGEKELEILYDALIEADNRIREIGLQCKSKMGAAVAAMIVRNNNLYYTWQGNVRIYILNDILKQITEDHILNIGYGKTGLTRCIKGAGLREDVPLKICSLKDCDKIIVCTDGMYSLFPEIIQDLSVQSLEKFESKPNDDSTIVTISFDN